MTLQKSRDIRDVFFKSTKKLKNNVSESYQTFLESLEAMCIQYWVRILKPVTDTIPN